MNLQNIYKTVSNKKNPESSANDFVFAFCKEARKQGYKEEQCHKHLSKAMPSYKHNLKYIQELFVKYAEYEKKRAKIKKENTYFGANMNEMIRDFISFFALNYDAFYDNIISTIFIKRKLESEFKKIADKVVCDIWHEFNQQSQRHLSKSTIDDLLQTSIVKESSWLQQFIDELPKYDGKDYISEIANSVQTTNQELFIERFTRWFVGMVAGIIRPEVTNDLVLVLIGKQGVGKTRFFKRLMKGKLAMYYLSKLLKMRDKDTEIALVENALLVIDEIDALNFKENTALKELITSQKVKTRKPYAKNQEEFPRLATIAGTTNKKQFLTDPTGSRRYLCFEVLSADNSAILPVEGAFSQAIEMIKTGFEYWIEGEEIVKQEAYNEEYQFIDPEEEILQQFTRKPTVEDSENIIEYFQTSILLPKLQKLADSPKSLSNSAVRKLGAALSKLDYPRKSKNGRKMWAVVFLEDENGLTPMDEGSGDLYGVDEKTLRDQIDNR